MIVGRLARESRSSSGTPLLLFRIVRGVCRFLGGTATAPAPWIAPGSLVWSLGMQSLRPSCGNASRAGAVFCMDRFDHIGPDLAGRLVELSLHYRISAPA